MKNQEVFEQISEQFFLPVMNREARVSTLLGLVREMAEPTRSELSAEQAGEIEDFVFDVLRTQPFEANKQDK